MSGILFYIFASCEPLKLNNPHKNVSHFRIHITNTLAVADKHLSARMPVDSLNMTLAQMRSYKNVKK